MQTGRLPLQRPSAEHSGPLQSIVARALEKGCKLSSNQLPQQLSQGLLPLQRHRSSLQDSLLADLSNLEMVDTKHSDKGGSAPL